MLDGYLMDTFDSLDSLLAGEAGVLIAAASNALLPSSARVLQECPWLAGIIDVL